MSTHPVPWTYDLNYEGKNKYVYTLFDSLTYNSGDLQKNTIIYNSNNKLSVYCDSLKVENANRLSFLQSYCKKYKIEILFQKLAEAEIDATYINKLLTPLNENPHLNIYDYPESYLKILTHANFNNENLYFKTNIYSEKAYPFAALVLRQVDKKVNYGSDGLTSVYAAIKYNFCDSIRNHLLTSHLLYFLGNPDLNFKKFDSLYTDLKSFCKNRYYLSAIDSKYVESKKLSMIKYNLDNALNSSITDISGNKAKVKDLFKSKPILLICWASWCGPCIREIPAEKKLEAQYGKDIDFIYLSFDSNAKLWKGKVAELNLSKRNFLLTQYFRSDFAKFYKISAIPFYLLYDRNGEIVELDNWRPSNKEFKALLEKSIK